MSTIATHSLLNISETVTDRGLVPMDYPNRKWHTRNGYVTDDVMWPWKVKLVLVTRIRLERNISKTAGDAISNSR